MGITSGGYKLLLLLHILTVVVGIGSNTLNGLYGRESRQRQGPEGRAIAEATQFVAQIATYVIYLIPVTGILLVLSSDSVYKFSDTFVWVSLVLYVIGLGISHGVLRPNLQTMIGLMRELEAAPPVAAGPSAPETRHGPPPQVAKLERHGRIVGMSSSVLHVLLVVFLALMIWQPR
ncbi:MAG TPA: hypothetical protein VFB78_18185 [Acidimicrobiales bacterium]|nr:hypothetical protein [Acidimicrobiales bacterium]